MHLICTVRPEAASVSVSMFFYITIVLRNFLVGLLSVS